VNQIKTALKVGKETLYFCCNRAYTTTGEKFLITVYKDGGHCAFDMQKDNIGKWKIADHAPIWVRAIEKDLVEAISRIS
jgi:hypothetical protein